MNGRRARVSVVVASFNGSEHITEQLASIAGQTLPPVEIIVSDDSSTDATAERVREFAARSTVPVVLVENRHQLGYPENFLRAALRAQGELIGFSDQDDVWLPDKLSRAATAFGDPSVMLWVHEARVVDEQLRPLPDKRFHTGFAKRTAHADPLHPLHGSHSVFRAELLRYLPPHDRPASVYGSHPAEHDEWIKFAAVALGRVAWDPAPLMLYRRHRGALTTSAPVLPRAEVLRGLDERRHGYAIRAARERSAYLRRRSEAPECVAVRGQLLAAAERYERLVPALARRVRTRQAETRLGRARSLTEAIGRGDYRRMRDGGLGLWALVQDVYRAVSPGTAVP
jgi:glycosyltransferase involved in cell wall biosynthesis